MNLDTLNILRDEEFEALINKVKECTERYRRYMNALQLRTDTRIPFIMFRQSIVELSYEVIGFLSKYQKLFEGREETSIKEAVSKFREDVTNFLSYMFDVRLDEVPTAQMGFAFVEHIRNSLEYTAMILKNEKKKIFIKEVLKRVEIIPRFKEMRELKKRKEEVE